MRLTIKNYHKILGVDVMDDWYITNVVETNTHYEFSLAMSPAAPLFPTNASITIHRLFDYENGYYQYGHTSGIRGVSADSIKTVSGMLVELAMELSKILNYFI